jgi:hypothetical protein
VRDTIESSKEKIRDVKSTCENGRKGGIHTREGSGLRGDRESERVIARDIESESERERERETEGGEEDSIAWRDVRKKSRDLFPDRKIATG